MAGEDRRREKRHPIQMPVKMRPTEGVTPYTAEAESVNISGSGVYFQLSNPPKMGTHVELSFVMPGDVTGTVKMKIRCRARVIRTDNKSLPEGMTGIAAHIERFESIVAES
jgi:PilZ domain-containing protein